VTRSGSTDPWLASIRTIGSPPAARFPDNSRASNQGPLLLDTTRHTKDSVNLREAVPATKSWPDRVIVLVPGLISASAIAVLAVCLRTLPLLSVVSPMMLAVLIGVTLNNVMGKPNWMKDGILFSQRQLLRIAIVLLGLQLTFAEVVRLGLIGLVILAAALTCTFVFTVRVARFLGVEAKLAKLIAAGTSAVVAANAVVGGKEEDVTYAVACVTIFGTLAMFLCPLFPELLHLSARDFGLWTGSSIHEIAQVVAASFQQGQTAGEIGTVAKLSRVMMLAPLVVAVDLLSRRGSRGEIDGEGTATSPRSPAIPWFVVGFIAAAAVNSVVTIPAEIKSNLMWMTTFLLTVALAAMGMQTDLVKLRRKGLRPALLGALASLFIAIFSLACIKLFG
jgi:uncharacterized integral membrane protein (TIGR00698 family)